MSVMVGSGIEVKGPFSGSIIRVPHEYTEEDVRRSNEMQWSLEVDFLKNELGQVTRDRDWFRDKCQYLEKQNKELRDEIDAIKRLQDAGRSIENSK